MSGPAKPTDTIAEAAYKQGFFLQAGRWTTRKQIMIEARYGNTDGGAIRRAKRALKSGWHGTESFNSYLAGPKGRLP